MARKQDTAKNELERRKKAESGFVSDRFPAVSGLAIKIIYYQNAANPVLMVRTINVYPSSSSCFHLQCPLKDCTGGGFDLTRDIWELIRSGRKSGKGKMVCGGEKEAQGPVHASISYQITVQYSRCAN